MSCSVSSTELDMSSSITYKENNQKNYFIIMKVENLNLACVKLATQEHGLKFMT
jgi:hypothetical protein